MGLKAGDKTFKTKTCDRRFCATQKTGYFVVSPVSGRTSQASTSYCAQYLSGVALMNESRQPGTQAPLAPLAPLAPCMRLVRSM